jgi:cytochrome c556
MTVWTRVWLAAVLSLGVALPAFPQDNEGLNLREIMVAIIAPTTNKIWGAYDIKTDTQWLELDQAASAVIAAAQLTAQGGGDGVYAEQAKNADWQAFTQQLISAARSAQLAIRNHDEEAMFTAGNELMYPPCESCHQIYLPK